MHVVTHLTVHDSAFLDLGRWILEGFPSSPATWSLQFTHLLSIVKYYKIIMLCSIILYQLLNLIESGVCWREYQVEVFGKQLMRISMQQQQFLLQIWCRKLTPTLLWLAFLLFFYIIFFSEKHYSPTFFSLSLLPFYTVLILCEGSTCTWTLQTPETNWEWALSKPHWLLGLVVGALVVRLQIVWINSVPIVHFMNTHVLKSIRQNQYKLQSEMEEMPNNNPSNRKKVIWRWSKWSRRTCRCNNWSIPYTLRISIST